MRSRTTHQATAFTLIECVVYCSVLFMVVGLAFMTYYRVEQNNRRLRQNADDILRVLRAGEQWREDIRHATGLIQTAASTAEQELLVPQKTGPVKYFFREGSVWRQKGPRPACFLAGVNSSTMAEDKRRFATGWRWEVELKARQKVTLIRPLFTFEAAAREDQP